MIRALEADWEHYLLVEVTDSVIREAGYLTEAHRLRAYDAVHLASASLVKNKLAEPLVFASWDADLEAAARRTGLEPLRGRSLA